MWGKNNEFQEIHHSAFLIRGLRVCYIAFINRRYMATPQAFINAVNAQRGKKITEEEADALIEDAQSIIDLIRVRTNPAVAK